ncbi:hypothetical protein F441_08212 [Phytophthora nicotianae CJ01A1]|uniref:Uncharacterized protein n=1 Tax=Phytophthora nicotianae CJ01A1 TaxID=1317063 RepID=W2X3P6_PHYNI|nr:hypothetical protein F441_08212 [Phytophthora nicotianae CJ01A1]
MQRLVSSDLSTQTLISSQTAVGIAPAAVVATIRHAHPETSILAKDVANHKRVDRREALASNTPTELLLKQLSTNKFFSSIR